MKNHNYKKLATTLVLTFGGIVLLSGNARAGDDPAITRVTVDPINNQVTITGSAFVDEKDQEDCDLAGMPQCVPPVVRIGWGGNDPGLTVLAENLSYTTDNESGFDTVTVDLPDNSMGNGLAAGDYKISVAQYYEDLDNDSDSAAKNAAHYDLTIDSVLTESEVIAFVTNNDFVPGPHTEDTDTTRSDTEILSVVGPHTEDTTRSDAEILSVVGPHTEDTTRSDAEILSVVGPHTEDTTRSDAEILSVVGPHTVDTTRSDDDIRDVVGPHTVDTDTTRSDAEILAVVGPHTVLSDFYIVGSQIYVSPDDALDGTGPRGDDEWNYNSTVGSYSKAMRCDNGDYAIRSYLTWCSPTQGCTKTGSYSADQRPYGFARSLDSGRNIQWYVYTGTREATVLVRVVCADNNPVRS